MLSLVAWGFWGSTVVIVGMKMKSTPAASSLRMWPCTSLAGKHTVSEVTAVRPSSYMRRVEVPLTRTSNPSARQNVFQKGSVSQ